MWGPELGRVVVSSVLFAVGAAFIAGAAVFGAVVVLAHWVF